MFEPEITKFQCPYCSHKYDKVVVKGVIYKYKENHYEDERCPHCNKTFLYN